MNAADWLRLTAVAMVQEAVRLDREAEMLRSEADGLHWWSWYRRLRLREQAHDKCQQASALRFLATLENPRNAAIHAGAFLVGQMLTRWLP